MIGTNYKSELMQKLLAEIPKGLEQDSNLRLVVEEIGDEAVINFNIRGTCLGSIGVTSKGATAHFTAKDCRLSDNDFICKFAVCNVDYGESGTIGKLSCQYAHICDRVKDVIEKYAKKHSISLS